MLYDGESEVITKNIRGMRKTSDRRPFWGKTSSKKQLVWMLRGHSLDRLPYLKLSRMDYLGYIRNNPQHRGEYLKHYREVIKMWI